ncbi:MULTISPECIES: hypothetical protein [Paenibacillus]|uniref:Uncharacterized protein n=1 Tax=Paenibacillus macerans TaxID=44252 RepID=A0A090ZT13_PAEMA|nr:hypothetical protein [Paenibacillus macerans]KFN07271.1 hypothetical protein DJ90_5648 [Paenibacillus macerans]MCY7558203.1 hypothetical protein [Paenibacillus macerans]MEC0154659.1 hypothetical protein [Paenibacillus macerans]SUA85608.1 Uncharacterised protein [Paenibacillus macerans]
MDKLVYEAFRKLQKKEHLLRVARDRMATGRITREMFRKEEAAIIEAFKLTTEEQRAYESYSKMQRKKS